jgi:hypothetical protein
MNMEGGTKSKSSHAAHSNISYPNSVSHHCTFVFEFRRKKGGASTLSKSDKMPSRRVQNVLNNNAREKVCRFLRTGASKHELLFNTEVDPRWPKYRAYYVVVNQFRPNLSGAEAKNYDKMRGGPQILVQDLCGFHDGKQAFKAHFKINNNVRAKFFNDGADLVRALQSEI